MLFDAGPKLRQGSNRFHHMFRFIEKHDTKLLINVPLVSCLITRTLSTVGSTTSLNLVQNDLIIVR